MTNTEEQEKDEVVGIPLGGFLRDGVAYAPSLEEAESLSEHFGGRIFYPSTDGGWPFAEFRRDLVVGTRVKLSESYLSVFPGEAGSGPGEIVEISAANDSNFVRREYPYIVKFDNGVVGWLNKSELVKING